MNKWTIAAAFLSALPLAAQNSGAAFQYVITTSGEGAKTLTFREDTKAVTGKPLTATEDRHTLQVLGDGTRIESKTSDKFYRDDQGRTRTERADGTAVIQDPVGGATAEINAKSKIVRRSTGYSYTTTPPGPAASAAVAKQTAELKAKLADAVKSDTFVTTNDVIVANGASMPAGSYALTTGIISTDKVKAEAASKAQRNEENLGFQTVNGVLAQGTRTTTTIPAGQIGNDRPIQVVSERWFSPDLQLLIRSVNKDPRFGETTYDLNITSQGAPDPALFQMPANTHQPQ